ncbi:major facilitator superfamily transporter [Nocardia nova SH22a]|uniref:Major facilitator superfamily transporter n=1 Tax=Nocardia nova SH22a TaxID=1415166 RepID=W5TML6_9NOCA|nr:MFS transporter [Nocardia nova]AHH18476.1 major facilitator superfamily transporter [Nocardia nova SH22a]
MRSRGEFVAVAAAYGAQGLGYATVVTVLPQFKARLGIGEMTVSLLLLGTCLAAAAGSVLADLIAVRWGSRQALCAGLVMEAVALLAASVPTGFGPFLTAFVVYGIGIGVVDAAANMQGVLAQKRTGATLFGSLYAAYTAAAIVGALVVSGCVAAGVWVLPLILTALVQLAVVTFGMRRFDPARAAHRVHDDTTTRSPLPWAGISAVGALVLAAFTIDSAISSWSTVYLADGLHVGSATAPLGYAVYQAAVLVARLAVDPAVRVFGRGRITVAAIVVGLLGTGVVAAVPDLAGAIAGFAAAGTATGALVPIAFGAAGELRPDRSDEVIARVNLFNYLGAVAGAVTLGMVAAGPSLGPAFAVPALVLLAATPAVRRIPGVRPINELRKEATPCTSVSQPK